jgi:uncharacterized membrane protein
MRRLIASIAAAAVLAVPATALAYVGPGAGLSLLGALWALIAAVATAFLFIFAWPLRKMLRRRRAARAAGIRDDHAGPAGAVAVASKDERSR